MSLTARVKDPTSTVSQFMRERFPGADAFMQPVRKELMALPALRPAGDVQGYPYGTVGMAIDYRLRYYFPPRPVMERVARMGAHCDPYVASGWENPNGGPPTAAVERAAAFFRGLETAIAQLTPADRRLTPADEQVLARSCYVLALFEEIYRSGRMDPGLTNGAADLLDIAAPAVIEDLCALSWAFYDAGLLPLTAPTVLNPTFMGSGDVGGADADLIVDGCLIDIKTTVPSGMRNTLGVTTLYQLLGYALLDYEDEFDLHAVGIYLPRQSRLLRWEVAELLPALCGAQPATTLGALRADFRALLAPAAQLSPRRKSATRPG
jgi:hypothetical protein